MRYMRILRVIFGIRRKPGNYLRSTRPGSPTTAVYIGPDPPSLTLFITNHDQHALHLNRHQKRWTIRVCWLYMHAAQPCWGRLKYCCASTEVRCGRIYNLGNPNRNDLQGWRQILQRSPTAVTGILGHCARSSYTNAH